MREIEVKARVENLAELIKTIEKLGGKLSDAIVQHDYVFTRGDAVGAAGSVFVRVRTETKNSSEKHYFTLKKGVAGHGDKIEHETEIADADAMLGAVRDLDFTPYVEVEKTRRTAKVDKFEICLDTVENLGDFIEIETFADDAADHLAVEDELWQFAKKLGVSKPAEPLKGYDVMIREGGGEK